MSLVAVTRKRPGPATPAGLRPSAIGEKFRREDPRPPYTADFCCVEWKLILEIEGAEHFTEPGREHDRVRDEALARQGYRVVRIAGYDVLREPDETRQRIEQVVRERMKELGME